LTSLVKAETAQAMAASGVAQRGEANDSNGAIEGRAQTSRTAPPAAA